jgi:hypothetical protein
MLNLVQLILDGEEAVGKPSICGFRSIGMSNTWQARPVEPLSRMAELVPFKRQSLLLQCRVMAQVLGDSALRCLALVWRSQQIELLDFAHVLDAFPRVRVPLIRSNINYLESCIMNPSPVEQVRNPLSLRFDRPAYLISAATV